MPDQDATPPLDIKKLREAFDRVAAHVRIAMQLPFVRANRVLAEDRLDTLVSKLAERHDLSSPDLDVRLATAMAGMTRTHYGMGRDQVALMLALAVDCLVQREIADRASAARPDPTTPAEPSVRIVNHPEPTEAE